MKKLLLVLLVLAFSAPAGADVFVYKWTSKEVEYGSGGGDWHISKYMVKGYVVIDTDSSTADLTFIHTGKTKMDDKPVKYYSRNNPADIFDFQERNIQAGNKIKKMLFIVNTEGNRSYLLMGEVKPVGFKGQKIDLAKKLDGQLFINGYTTYLHITKETMRLDKKFTSEALTGLSADETALAVINYLKSKGYVDLASL